MPDEKEVASFTASTDTGAKLAAAALFIQEEWRAYRHRQLVAVGRLTYVCHLCSSFTSKLVLKVDQTLILTHMLCCHFLLNMVLVMYQGTYMWFTGKNTLVACESPLEGEVP